MSTPSQHSLVEQHLGELLAPVMELMADASVSEIMVNGPGTIYCERRGQLQPCTHRFEGEPELMAAIRGIAQFAGKSVSPQRPILEARLPDGTRVQAVVPPAAPTGPVLSLRRFATHKLGIEDLLRHGSLTREAAEYLAERVCLGDNILVSGGTGSGKTSLLNVLSSFIPEAERVIVIEDVQELQLQKAHVVQLQSRPADERGRGRVSIRDLFTASLRLRPDRIVVGELRGEEALDLVQAMTSGHGGGMSSIHASHPFDTLRRIETCCLMADLPLGLSALRPQIASAIDLIVQTDRQRDGRRRVTHICAVADFGEAGYRVTPRFALDAEGELRRSAPEGVPR